MPRGFRPRLRAAALLIAVAAGLLVLGKLLSVKGFAWASEFASIAGFFVALVALIWPWLVHQMSGPRPVSMSRIAEAAEELAGALSRQWAEEVLAGAADRPGYRAAAMGRRLSPGGRSHAGGAGQWG